MMLGHGLVVFMFLLKKSLSKKSDISFYSKTMCVLVMIIAYMASFLYVQYVSLRQDEILNPVNPPFNIIIKDCMWNETRYVDDSNLE